jgi:hypothetical protein
MKAAIAESLGKVRQSGKPRWAQPKQGISATVLSSDRSIHGSIKQMGKDNIVVYTNRWTGFFWAVVGAAALYFAIDLRFLHQIRGVTV